MSLEDALAILAFLVVILLGLFVMTIQDALSKRPRGRVRSRLDTSLKQSRSATQQELQHTMLEMQRAARRRLRREAMGALGRHLIRVEIVAGLRGIWVLIFTGLAAFAGSSILVGVFVPAALSIKLFIIAASVPLAVALVYGRMVARYRLKFLDQLPDIIDMIIRGSQAGIPVPQTLRNVGQEYDWPAGPEFSRMGNRLQLGSDMEEVLDEAEQRIELPDFSFLAVTLLLQRETGGSLSDTLGNLAAVIRARRDLRLKARALTAEGRLSANIISAIPFFSLAFMAWANPEYLAVLFETQAGRKLLLVAGVMLVLGMLLIRKIARLDT